MRVLLTVLVACVGVHSTGAQLLFKGSCPTQNVVQGFDATRYAGIWYENRNYFAAFQIKQDCVTATYSIVPEITNGVKVVNAGRLLGIKNSLEGSAYLTDPSANEGKLYVSFFNKGAPSPPAAGTQPNYWVLDTDYTSFTIVWSCNDKNKFGKAFNTQILWILTRERFPSQATIDTAVNIIKRRELDTSRLYKTYHSDKWCPAPIAQENP